MKIAIDAINPATNRAVKVVTATPTGLKFAGRVQPAGMVFGIVKDKGDIRKMRKQLREAGFNGHAAAPVLR